MTHINPTDAPLHVKEALKVQLPNLKPSQIISVIRTWESLRPEAEDPEAVPWARAVALDDDAAVQLKERIEQITETLLNYLRHCGAGDADESEQEALRAFEEAFKTTVMGQVGMALIGLVKGLEISPLGEARISARRFRGGIGVDLKTGKPTAQVEDMLTEQEKLAIRASWIVDAIRNPQVGEPYEGLLPAEQQAFEDLAALDVDEVTEPAVTTLEYLLIQSCPNHALFFTEDGRDELRRIQLQEMRRYLVELKDRDYSGLSVDDRLFLVDAEVRPDEDFIPEIMSRVFHLAFESRNV